MTREDAITVLNMVEAHGSLVIQAKEMAIKALEREDCDDYVSRQAVIDLVNAECVDLQDGSEIWRSCVNDTVESIYLKVKDMPPVTPVRKKGKWINKSQKSGCGITFIASECTCCGKKTFFNCDELIYRFCPNCGAEMESEE